MAEKIGVSNAFQTFFKEAPDQQKIWMETVKKLDGASKLDKKQRRLHISRYWRRYGSKAASLFM